MDELKEIFRQSIRTDREFPVREGGWNKLEQALDNQQKRQLLLIWRKISIILLVFLAVGCFLYFFADNRQDQPIAEKRTPEQERIVAETNSALESDQSPESQITSASIVSEKRRTAKPEKESVLPIESPTAAPKLSRVKSPTGQDQAINEVKDKVRDAVSDEKEQLPTVQETGPVFAKAENIKTSNFSASKDSSIPAGEYVLQALPARFKVTEKITGASIKSTGGSEATAILFTSILPDLPQPYIREQAAPRWSLSLNFGSLLRSKIRKIEYYNTIAGNPDLGRVYSFPNGDTLQLFFGGQYSEKTVETSYKYLRMNIHRKFSSGLGAKLGLIYSWQNYGNAGMDGLVNQIPNVFYYTEKGLIQHLIADFGVDYTFFRDTKWQPTIGLNTFVAFGNHIQSEYYAYFPEQSYQNLERKVDVRSLSAALGFYLESALQYRISEQISIEGHLLITELFREHNAGPSLGLGLGIRHSW
ncbi:hypothetical protein [Flavilitoribacter nigricans]|uniref:Uncharacterized protein n=1 Tax=Flavilitoribacter nigricans (strain ATCC 23147 / DSM 23189 / NBRC 102662 / NCIMB 1420 / SS-2) TaxID=1122177 RepID=A0A2D0NHW2_FLAN2|nr:hypothetical protein [Flavilitoribacter nigricans]PHN07966.1 hypothetical protein CRP01_04215 [Flavilitoribacter nigricans DSM 23189 = NBRC 102662]